MITGYGYQLFTNADAAVQALKAGQVDCVDFLPPASARPIKSDANLQVEGFGGGIPYFLAVNYSKNNTKHPELNKVEVRQALDLAMDRDAIIVLGVHRLRRAWRVALAQPVRAEVHVGAGAGDGPRRGQGQPAA